MLIARDRLIWWNVLTKFFISLSSFYVKFLLICNKLMKIVLKVASPVDGSWIFICRWDHIVQGLSYLIILVIPILFSLVYVHAFLRKFFPYHRQIHNASFASHRALFGIKGWMSHLFIKILEITESEFLSRSRLTLTLIRLMIDAHISICINARKGNHFPLFSVLCVSLCKASDRVP